MNIKIMILVIAILAVFSSYKSLAYDFECPENWSPAMVEFGPDAQGCSWIVSFCYICEIVYSNNTVHFMRVMNCEPKNPEYGCTFPQDPGWLLNKLRDFILSQCTVPPCSTVYCRTIIQEFPLCWQWWTAGSYYPNEKIYRYWNWLEACPDGGYCQIVKKICYDYEHGVYDYTCQDWTDTYQIIDLNCQTEQIEEPENPIPDFEGIRVRTECFKKYTCP